MNKKKFLIVLVLFFICFYFNMRVISAKTYPYCDISQYGTVTVTAGGNSTESEDFVVGVGDGKVSTNHNSMLTGKMTLDETAKKSQEKEDNNKWWKNGTATITYTIDAGPGGRVSEITYSLYEDTKLLSYTKVCQSQIEPKLYPNSEVAIVTFKINKGHLAKINLNAKYKAGINEGYVAGGGSGGVSVSVKKGLSNNESMPIHTTNGKEETTTSASAGCINSDGTGCDDTEKIVSSSNAKTAAGTKVGGKKTIITDEKGNIIGGRTNSCTDVRLIINNYWKYVMVATPILLIVMMSIDFFKAMASNDADAIKKSINNTVKRTIAAVVLLALPALLSFILGIFGLPLCI